MATTFTSKYNTGSTGYIFKENDIAFVTVTKVDFREGCDTLAFIPDTDFIYTTSQLSVDGVNYIKTPEGLLFATKNEMKTYIDNFGVL